MRLTVVLDVNILASAAVSENGLPRVVVRKGLQKKYRLVSSRHIFKKLDDTFQKPYFAARLTQQARKDYLALLEEKSQREAPDPTVRGVAPDLEDDLVLGTVVAAQADVLVTGDKGLLDLGEYRGVRIVTAAQFLDMIGTVV